jgi:hypothetical protein
MKRSSHSDDQLRSVLALQFPAGGRLIPVPAVPCADDHAPALADRRGPRAAGRRMGDELIQRQPLDDKTMFKITCTICERRESRHHLIEQDLNVTRRLVGQRLLAHIDGNALAKSMEERDRSADQYSAALSGAVVTPERS